MDAVKKFFADYKPARTTRFCVAADGTGSVEFDTTGWETCTVEVSRGRLFVRENNVARRNAFHAEWVGEDALMVGRAVLAGEMHPHIFADWCDENKPSYASRFDGGLRQYNPGRFLRLTIA